MENWNDIEQMMKNQAEKTSFEFKDDFWNEMSSQLDAELPAEDAMFANAQESSFDYKQTYWDEMSALLDASLRKRMLVFWTNFGVASIAGFTLLFFVLQHNPSSESLALNSDFDYYELNGDWQNTSNNQVVSITQFQKPAADNDLPNRISNSFKDGKNDVLKYVKYTDVLATNRNENNASIKSNSNSSRKSNQIENTELNNVTLLPQLKDKNDPNSIDKLEQEKSILLTDKEDFAINPILLEALNGNANRNLIDVNLPKRKSVYSSMFIKAGGGIARTPIGNVVDREKLAYFVKAGLGYELRAKNFGFETGLNVTYRNGLNHHYMTTKRIFGMKLYTETVKTTYKGMMSVELPVLASYHYGRHRFGAGASLFYNALIQSDLYQFNNYSDETEFTKNNFGVRSGIKPVDLKLNLNYEFAITQRFKLGVSAQFGMLNQFDNATFKTDENYKDINALVYLKYSIFKF